MTYYFGKLLPREDLPQPDESTYGMHPTEPAPAVSSRRAREAALQQEVDRLKDQVRREAEVETKTPRELQLERELAELKRQVRRQAIASPIPEPPAGASAVKPAAEMPAPQAVRRSRFRAAVLPLKSSSLAYDEVEPVTVTFRDALENQGVASLASQPTLGHMLVEGGFQETGCTDDACALSIGKTLGLKKVAFGSVDKTPDGYLVNIWVLTVETGQSSFAGSATGETPQSLNRSLKALAGKAARKF